MSDYLAHTGIEYLFDPFDRIMIAAGIERRRYFEDTRARLVRLLHRPLRPSNEWDAYVGQWRRRLVLAMDGIEAIDRTPPFGWRRDFEPGRDVVLFMPAWVYYIRRSRHVYWWMMRMLFRAGFWALAAEGGYYRDGHWTWAWWRTLDERWTFPTYRFSRRVLGIRRIKPPSRWERLGWWIERYIINDWKTRMPEWG